MGAKKTYADKLKDPRWQRKRLNIFNRDNWRCALCRTRDATLHVHHLAYSGEPWEAPDRDLVTLCENCHERVEAQELPIEYRKLAATIPGASMARAIAGSTPEHTGGEEFTAVGFGLDSGFALWVRRTNGETGWIKDVDSVRIEVKGWSEVWALRRAVGHWVRMLRATFTRRAEKKFAESLERRMQAEASVDELKEVPF